METSEKTPATEPNPAGEATEPTAAEMKAQLEEANKKLADALKTIQGKDQANSRLQREPPWLKDLRTDLQMAHAKIDALAEAALVDEPVEVVPQTKIERFKARLPKPPQPQTEAPNPEVAQMRVMFKKLVDKNKLDPRSLPDEVKEAWEDAEKQYERGDLESAYDTLDKGIENYKVTEAERKRKREEMDKSDRETKSKSLQSDRRSSEGAGTGKYTAKDVREFAPTGNITEMKARIAAINKQMRGET